ncbi:MAG: long-chain-acyl-CoA synthetase, partial [Rhizobiales bacterium]|nr:long-chain-acyl-CoA synthetase [Hyphomicrobiales bacterium]
LAHCINIVSPKHVIVAGIYSAQYAQTEHLIGNGDANAVPEFWIFGEANCPFAQEPKMLLPQLDAADNGALSPQERPALTTEDKCLYIYTSGTTGLPKAANLIHYRVQAIMNGFSGATNSTSKDRMYICMPLYHSAAGVIGIGCVLSVGGSVYMTERFSARTFWDDVVDNDCTMFQYIGEMCRYLLNSPPHPKERMHNLRLISGNGLRPDIWERFRDRFQFKRILEWYAATEGNAVFFNFDQKIGAIGRIPKWAERKFVTEVVRYDYDNIAPYRNADGRCEKCDPDETGEVISQILNDPKRPSQRFEGYSNSSENERKILENVFNEGDRWFRTGDLMRRDALGYFYFVDRIGDTFRWKGENVATSEVSENLSVYDGVDEANAYGVVVPGMEGRAGMVALVVEDGFDPQEFYSHVCEHLPDYARPVFLRIQGKIETTGTFKQRKIELVKQGFDLQSVSDPILIMDHKAKAYVSLSQTVYQEIIAGQRRL